MVIVEQGVDGFLQYLFFVVDDDIWCVQFDKVFEVVVMVDYMMIEVVKVRCCEMAVIQWYQWMQFWWDDWDDCQDYLFWFVVGGDKVFEQFKMFGVFFQFQFGVGFFYVFMDFGVFGFYVYVDQDFVDCFSIDVGGECVFVIFVLCVYVFFFGEKLEWLQWGQVWFDDNIVFEVENMFDIFECYVEDYGDL